MRTIATGRQRGRGIYFRIAIDNFKAALERKKYKKGFVVAFSFTKGVHEEVARLKHDEGLDIKLVEVEALLFKKEPIFGA